MTKYEIAVRLLAEYCDCPSKDGTTVDLPMEWCENHCKYEGENANNEETLQCWEKVINDRYEVQNEEDKTEPCWDAVSRDFMRKLGATCIAKRGEDGELVAILSIDSLPSVLNDLPPIACNCSEVPNGSECEDAVSREAVLKIRDLPSVTPEILACGTVELVQEPCADTISREAAIDALDKRFDSIPMEQTTEILLLRKDLRNLPAAQPQRKTGEWVLQSDDYHEYYECDQCGIAVGLDDVRNFCPNCGAKMEVFAK